ncbi:hypothetical protein VCHC47A1_3017, partial [Vibrio cholerae HC-47A1]
MWSGAAIHPAKYRWFVRLRLNISA